MKTFFAVLLAVTFCLPSVSKGIAPDSIYKPNIKTVRLFKQGNQLTFPVINLNSNDRLELHFDDLDADVKNYYYTYQLCDYNWAPVNVMTMDYLSGFSQNKVKDYRFSSVALTRYTHYKVLLPQSNGTIKKSGNYILKIYLNGDTSQLAFTKRFMVLNPMATIAGSITQPTTPQYFNRYQKLVFNVDFKGITNFNPQQQVHVVLLQNFRWDNAMLDVKPTFIRGSSLEYNSETVGVFPGGKEWRWLDLRDFHLQSDRVASAEYNKRTTDIFLRTDRAWANEPYIFYPDLNGLSSIQAVRGIDPFYEGDYAMVYFSLDPPGGRTLPGKDIYLFGQLTNYEFTDSLRMRFNIDKGVYETHLLLKQGYYDYTYLMKDERNPFETTTIDGNFYEAENAYTVLVYYRPFGARADELIAVSMINSRTDRQGFGF